MKFYGKGLVWDAAKNKPLCRFVGGIFEIENKAAMDKLIKMDYKHDGEYPKEPIKPKVPKPKPKLAPSQTKKKTVMK